MMINTIGGGATMKKDRLEFDESFLKKAKEERKAKKEGIEEQQDLVGQEAEPEKEKKIKMPKVKKEKAPKEKKVKVPKEKKVKEPKEKKVKVPKEKKVKTPKEVKPGSFSALHSMQTKVMVLVAVGVIVSVFALYQVMMSSMKELLIDSAIGKMLNVVTSYGKVIDKEESELNQGTSKNNYLEPEQYGALFEGIAVEGVENFQYMMLHRSGIIKYHPDESKEGLPTGIQELNDLIAGLNVGQFPENMYTKYRDSDTGEMMYISFYITALRSIAIVSASEAELLAPIASLRVLSLGLGVAILAVAVILAGLIVKRITKPLNQVTEVINETAKLNLRLPDYMDKLCARKDESGMIGRAVKEMSEYLHEVVSKIDETNVNINENMLKLEESSNQVHTLCMDNSATIQQLAANTAQVNEMTQIMNGHMAQMRTQAEEISRETEQSNKASDEIAGRAQNMQNSTAAAIVETKKMYQLIKDKTQIAVEGLKSVAKINELTKAIVEVSDQTSLLSLNASIEAARAGEAGRGFSVVASEISKLANRSLETVKDINEIIKEVNLAVANITASMEETSNFLEKTVLADYDNFSNIGVQYMDDADTFRAGMDNISKEIEVLNGAIKEIANAVEGISIAVGETSSGVNDIAEKTSGVVSATSDNYDLTNNTVTSVEELKEIIQKFEF